MKRIKSKWIPIKRMRGSFGSDYYLKVGRSWQTVVGIHEFQKTFGLKLRMDEEAKVCLEIQRKRRVPHA